MTTTTVPVDNTVMVGSVASSEHTVDMAGVDVVTRSRALRAPRWVIALGALILLSDGYSSGILTWLFGLV